MNVGIDKNDAKLAAIKLRCKYLPTGNNSCLLCWYARKHQKWRKKDISAQLLNTLPLMCIGILLYT